MVCPSVRADISVCLVLPYWLPETLLMSSLGACCHWLKRRAGVECVFVCLCVRLGVCVCVFVWEREKLEQLSWKLLHSVSASWNCFPLILPTVRKTAFQSVVWSKVHLSAVKETHFWEISVLHSLSVKWWDHRLCRYPYVPNGLVFYA